MSALSNYITVSKNTFAVKGREAFLGVIFKAHRIENLYVTSNCHYNLQSEKSRKLQHTGCSDSFVKEILLACGSTSVKYI